MIHVHGINPSLLLHDGDDEDPAAACECTRPRFERVVLFGWLELTDVHECAHCGRPPLTEIRTGGPMTSWPG